MSLKTPMSLPRVLVYECALWMSLFLAPLMGVFAGIDRIMGCPGHAVRSHSTELKFQFPNLQGLSLSPQHKAGQAVATELTSQNQSVVPCPAP